MITIPETDPNITGITFEVFRAGVVLPQTQTFLYDPEEMIRGGSLNDTSLDCNTFFRQVVSDNTVIRARTSISFDHSLRPSLPIPTEGKCAHLDSIGALIGMVVDLMAASGEFRNANQESELILHLAALTGRSLEDPRNPGKAPA
jgi:hypothetical protein